MPPPPPADPPNNAGARAGPRTDRLAMPSFIVGMLSVVCAWPFCLGVLLGPVAVTMGFVSRQRVASSLGTVTGSAYAISGVVLGVIGFLGSVAWLLFAWTSIANAPPCGSGGACFIP